jgi:hypothetical protein
MIKKNMNSEYNRDNNTDVAEKVLSYIEKENVQPYSKWYFIFTNEFFWALGLVSVTLGALSFAIILFTYFNAEPELYRVNYDSFADFLFAWVPIIWIVSLGFFTYVGYRNIQYTKRGYKYPFPLIILTSLMMSIVCGTILYAYGIAGALDREFARRVPLYRSVQELKREMALRPDRGGIGGEIILIADDQSSFTVKDFRGSIWVVSTEDLNERDRDVISEFLLVRVIGIPSTTTLGVMGTSTMHGCAVLPWEIKRGGNELAPSKRNIEMIKMVLRERKENMERTSICKGVQPYMIIQEIRNKIHQ